MRFIADHCFRQRMKWLFSIPLLYLTLLWPTHWTLSKVPATDAVENRVYFESANRIPEKGLSEGRYTWDKTSVDAHLQPRSLGLQTMARITEYGWTGNKMASGKWPYMGAVAISDYSIPFGTIILIKDKQYVVEDRTAKWIHKKYGLTVDIYSENPIGLKYDAVSFLAN